MHTPVLHIQREYSCNEIDMAGDQVIFIQFSRLNHPNKYSIFATLSIISVRNWKYELI